MRAVSYGWSLPIAITENPVDTQTLWLYVLQDRSYCRSKFYIEKVGIFDLFRSFFYPEPDDLHTQI